MNLSERHTMNGTTIATARNSGHSHDESMPNRPTLLRQFLPNADNPRARASMRMEMMLDAIQEERERQGIPYMLLAQLTGMSTETISRTLLGKRGVSLTEVVKIATALDVDPFAFIAASSAGAK
jgi:hypothetical protein